MDFGFDLPPELVNYLNNLQGSTGNVQIPGLDTTVQDVTAPPVSTGGGPISLADIQKAYRQVDPGKFGDIDRILAGIGPDPGGSFTLDQLRAIGAVPGGYGRRERGLTGLSGRSMGDWGSVLDLLAAMNTPAAPEESGYSPPEAPEFRLQAHTSSPGRSESIMDQLFQTAATGVGNNPIAQLLFNLSQGKLPQVLIDELTATTNEQFGKLGARFGTDLGTAISRGLGQASSREALQAMNQLFGLGTTTGNWDFQRSENALSRALQEYLATNDPLMNLLPLLLQGGLG